MGTLLPIRHPNRDFFIVDVSDANPKDDMASMEHPVFSLSVKPDMRELDYTSPQGNRLRVVPSGNGLATIRDKDILLYCVSKLVGMKNNGMEITPVVEASAHEIMVAVNWDTGGKSYQRFEEAMIRLRGTTIVTDIETGDEIETRGFGLVDSFDVIRKENGKESPFGRLSQVRIKLSDWMFRAVDAMEVLTIHEQYFRLRRPLERRLYEIARKHVGTKNSEFRIGIEKLRAKVGTNAPLKKFRFNLKEIIRDGNIPDYGLRLDGDIIVMQKLVPIEVIDAPKTMIRLRGDTLDKAKVYAQQIRTSVSELEREWQEWAADKVDEIKSPDAAFIGFCKKKVPSGGASRVTEAREAAHDAGQLALVMPDLSMDRK